MPDDCLVTQDFQGRPRVSIAQWPDLKTINGIVSDFERV